ncbi:MAG: hypothetical protein WD407_08085 [Rhodospirillales bacterium]
MQLKSNKGSRALCAIAAVTALAAAAVVAPAAQAADFSGKKINFIIPYPESGGSNIYGRFLAPLLEKHLPGKPTVLIRNMPGGASTRGINYFARTAKDDGLMLTMPTASALTQFVIGEKTVKFDFADFIPVITSPFGVVVYASPKFGVKKGEAAKLKGKEFVFGSRKPTGSELPLLVAFDLLGYKIKFVGGLSRGKARQAFARGETDLNYDTTASYLTKVVPLVEKGKAVVLFTYGFEQTDGKIVRDPMIQDAPSFFEAYEQLHGKPLGGAEGKTLKALFNLRIMASKMVVLPKKTKPDVLAAYHAAAKKVVNDPAFKSKQGLKIMGPYQQQLGDRALKAMQAGATLDSESRQWLQNWIKTHYGVFLKKAAEKKKKKE